MGILENRLKEKEQYQNEVIQKVSQDVIKPTDNEQSIVENIVNTVSEMYGPRISAEGIQNKDLQREIEYAIECESRKLNVDFEQQERIKSIAKSGVIGLGPLDTYINDPDVTEIIVQHYDKISVEYAKRGVVSVNATFNNEQHLQNVIQRIIQPIGKQLDFSKPTVNARLPDGSRVHATIPPVSPDGALLTIRKFSNKALTGEDYIKLGSLNQKMLDFLRLCVEGKCSLIVSGGTGTGKTTLLNMLSNYIPKNELIITIEDICELQLKSPNVRRLESRDNVDKTVMPTDTKALVKEALRMRPDRIIVGEIRDGTIVDMVSAMSTGHEGSMCTTHATSPLNLVNVRIPIFYSMSDTNFSDESQGLQISEALNLIVQIKRFQGKRIITHITEVGKANIAGRVELKDIFRWTKEDGFKATGYVPKEIIKKADENGVEINQDLFATE